MADQFRILNLIALEALCLLRKKKLKLLPKTRNLYLGRWDRVEVDKRQFDKICSTKELAPMSIEIIRAFDDMSDHLHYHDEAYAVTVILGKTEGYDEPVGCQVHYKSDKPIPAMSGVTLQIPPNTIHSFSGGKKPITFLSVQSKKIEKDYHHVRGK